MLNSSSLRKLIVFALISLLMTACAAQGAMGIIGAAVGSTLITGLLLLIGGTQSGCDPIVTACLSQEPSGYEIGPCLSAPPAGEMAGEMAGEIGPCLSAPPAGEMAGEMAGEIGPCLSAPPAGEMAGEMAGEIGPCLDVLPPDMGPPMDTDAGEPDAGMPGEKMGKATQGDRQDAVERLAQRGSLPEDVLARLRSRG